MGVCVSAQRRALQEEKQINDVISRELVEARNQTRQHYFVSMLGLPNVGKRTFWSQWKNIHNGYTLAERRAAVSAVHRFVIRAMQKLLHRSEVLAQQHDDVILVTDQALHAKHFILQLDHEARIEGQVGEWLQELWATPGIQATHQIESKSPSQDSKYQPTESKHFFDGLDVIQRPDYLPNNQDILYALGPTTSIFELPCPRHRGYALTLLLTSPRTTPHSKFLPCFTTPTALIYVVSLSDYDQPSLNLDPPMTLLHEALNDFEAYCYRPSFLLTKTIIVLMNKLDEFKEKLKKVDLRVCFPEYSGSSVEAACEFIGDAFKRRVRERRLNVYPISVCALENNDVLESVKDIIVRQLIPGCAGFDTY
eukprot:TRINITY_DN2166_c0_g1_i3.p1 TRINITY_DN2166_c0_g1~~TRINITY_DN2166_c0_g1_i3.p1  ORF type:complete len:366 (+),score=29.53 TRINITY_DN2166_c0_g1_i3:73-1170(+)